MQICMKSFLGTMTKSAKIIQSCVKLNFKKLHILLVTEINVY